MKIGGNWCWICVDQFELEILATPGRDLQHEIEVCLTEAEDI